MCIKRPGGRTTSLRSALETWSPAREIMKRRAAEQCKPLYHVVEVTEIILVTVQDCRIHTFSNQDKSDFNCTHPNFLPQDMFQNPPRCNYLPRYHLPKRGECREVDLLHPKLPERDPTCVIRTPRIPNLTLQSAFRLTPRPHLASIHEPTDEPLLPIITELHRPCIVSTSISTTPSHPLLLHTQTRQ